MSGVISGKSLDLILVLMIFSETEREEIFFSVFNFNFQSMNINFSVFNFNFQSMNINK